MLDMVGKNGRCERSPFLLPVIVGEVSLERLVLDNN